MCYACIMKLQRIILLFGIYLTFELSKYFKVQCSSPILNHALDFLLAQKYFEPHGKLVWPKLHQPDRSGNLTLECASTCYCHIKLGQHQRCWNNIQYQITFPCYTTVSGHEDIRYLWLSYKYFAHTNP